MAKSVHRKSVEAAFPDAAVGSMEIFIVDGKLLGTTKYLETRFGVTARQVTNWIGKGLEPSEYSLPKLRLFDIAHTEKWHASNIDKTKSNATKGRRTDVPVSPTAPPDDLDLVDKEEADRLLQIEKLKEQRIKNAALLKELIPAEDTDRAMAEQAVIHKSQYADDLDMLPAALEHKSSEDISAILEDHYELRMNNVAGFINRVFQIPDYLYTEINKLIEKAQ